MYRLIVDKQALSDFVKVTAPCIGVDPSTFNAPLYEHLRSFSRPLIDSIFGDSVPTVRMLVTIRTDLSNEVLVPDNGKFYTDCTASYTDEHPIDDTVILSAKSLVDRLFDCGDDTPQVIRRTIVYPVGASIIDDQVYVYVTVVIDHNLKSDKIFKIKDCHFEKISSIVPTNKLESKILDKLVIVKGGSYNV